MANTIGTLNLLQSIVDWGLELEKFDTAGTSEEYGNVRDDVAHHHDFDDAGALILHERSPINPKSIYATAKVAAGLPDDELLRRVRPARRRDTHVQQLRAAAEPALRDRDDHHAGAHPPEIELGALDPLRDFCFCTDGVRGHLMVAAHGQPGDVYVYGQGENISMADWAELIIRTGVEQGLWPDDRRIVTVEGRKRPGASDVMALRVGHEKLTRETGWLPKVSWEEGVPSARPLVRREPRALDRRVRLASDGRAQLANRRVSRGARERVVVTGGGGFLGSRLVERLEADGHEVVAARRRDTTSRRWTTPRACSTTTRRSSSSTSPPRWAGSARTARARPLLVREPHDGRARPRAGPPPRDGEARHRGDDLRVPEVRAGAVPRGGPLERLPRGDERSVRGREEGDPRRRAVLPRPVRHERGLPAPREPLRPGRQLRPRDLARDSRR